MIPRPRKAFGLFAGAVLLAALTLLVMRFWPSSEPTYKGRPLSYWFTQLPAVSGNETVRFSQSIYWATPSNALDHKGALVAVRGMGTNSLPFLLRKLGRHSPPSRLTILLSRYCATWPIIWNVMTKPQTQQEESRERAQATAGLLVLCPLPPAAEEKVRSLALDFGGPAWFQAGYVLKANQNPAVVRDALHEYQ